MFIVTQVLSDSLAAHSNISLTFLPVLHEA